MSSTDPSSTDPAWARSLRRHKIRDRALVLPLIGLVLLLPPVGGIFQLDARIAGVPLTAVYLFTVWLVLIVWAFALSRHLHDDSVATQPPHASEAATGSGEQDRHGQG